MEPASCDRPNSDGPNSDQPVRPKPRHRPGAGRRLVRHFSVDHTLSPEHRAAYEAKLLDPRQTTDSLRAWLAEKGYTHLSRAAVQRHRRRFAADVDGIRHDAAVASQYATIGRAQGDGALADAGQLRFEQMFVEQLFRMKKSEDRTAKEWQEIGKVLATLLANRREVEDRRYEGGQRAAGPAKTIDGVALRNKVRRILGVPLPGEPLPEYPPPMRVTEEPGRN